MRSQEVPAGKLSQPTQNETQMALAREDKARLNLRTLNGLSIWTSPVGGTEDAGDLNSPDHTIIRVRIPYESPVCCCIR